MSSSTGLSTISGASALTIGTGSNTTAYVTAVGPFTISAPITAGNLSVGGGGTLTVGAVNLGASPLVAVNQGTLALTGAVTASSGGVTYQVSSGATLTGALSLTGGGTLTGNGTQTGTLTVGSGGVVAPSALPGPGTMTVGNTVFSSGGGLKVGLSSSYNDPLTPGLSLYTSGLLTSTSTGTLNLSGLTAGSFTITPVSYTLSGTLGALYDYTQGTTASWVIARFPGGITGFNAADFTINTNSFTFPTGVTGVFSISQSASSDLMLTLSPGGIIPEPATMLALASGVLGLGGLIRRRIRRTAPAAEPAIAV
jgi:hypothetical protein